MRNLGLSQVSNHVPFQNFTNKIKKSELWLSGLRTCSSIHILRFGAHVGNVGLSLAYSGAHVPVQTFQN